MPFKTRDKTGRCRDKTGKSRRKQGQLGKARNNQWQLRHKQGKHRDKTGTSKTYLGTSKLAQQAVPGITKDTVTHQLGITKRCPPAILCPWMSLVNLAVQVYKLRLMTERYTKLDGVGPVDNRPSTD